MYILYVIKLKTELNLELRIAQKIKNYSKIRGIPFFYIFTENVLVKTKPKISSFILNILQINFFDKTVKI